MYDKYMWLVDQLEAYLCCPYVFKEGACWKQPDRVRVQKKACQLLGLGPCPKGQHVNQKSRLVAGRPSERPCRET